LGIVMLFVAGMGIASALGSVAKEIKSLNLTIQHSVAPIGDKVSFWGKATNDTLKDLSRHVQNELHVRVRTSADDRRFQREYQEIMNRPPGPFSAQLTKNDNG
jgi:hypothetical protein